MSRIPPMVIAVIVIGVWAFFAIYGIISFITTGISCH